MPNTPKPLSPEEEYIIVYKGTEPPGSGKYLHNKTPGIYTCRRCGKPLYKSNDKFDSGCGWPAFDDEIPNAIERNIDADGYRTEIACSHCGAHLGHVFAGERLTPKNIRHCVNSASLDFQPGKESTRNTPATNTAYFAAGCFWGVEHMFKQQLGVLSTSVGYMGGDLDYPNYKDVCKGDSGHAEVLRITFDPTKTTYEQLCKLFFEIHDFTQVNRQGPDIGEQYRSEIFTDNPEQENTTRKIIAELQAKGFKPATKITPAKNNHFWPAEDYHQDYYGKTGKTPYCHARRKVF